MGLPFVVSCRSDSNKPNSSQILLASLQSHYVGVKEEEVENLWLPELIDGGNVVRHGFFTRTSTSTIKKRAKFIPTVLSSCR